jgi:hypothetical protein
MEETSNTDPDPVMTALRDAERGMKRLIFLAGIGLIVVVVVFATGLVH